MNNKIRITLASFLAYFVMSGMLAPIGILSGPMAEHFSLPVTDITARFSWLTFGNLLGAVLALIVFNWTTLGRVMTTTYSIIAICLISLMYSEGLATIGVALGVVGVGCGIGLAGAALIISRSYDTEKRASMLIITDGSFSVAGVVTSWLAVAFVAREMHWSASYQFVAIIAVLIVVLIAVSTLPSTIDDEVSQTDESSTKWPFGVWLCIVALFLYTFGQWSILLWLPNYAEAQLGATREQAGSLVSQFWTGMFAAQVFVAWWVLKIGVSRLILLAASTTAVFFDAPMASGKHIRARRAGFHLGVRKPQPPQGDPVVRNRNGCDSFGATGVRAVARRNAGHCCQPLHNQSDCEIHKQPLCAGVWQHLLRYYGDAAVVRIEGAPQFNRQKID